MMTARRALWGRCIVTRALAAALACNACAGRAPLEDPATLEDAGNDGIQPDAGMTSDDAGPSGDAGALVDAGPDVEPLTPQEQLEADLRACAAPAPRVDVALVLSLDGLRPAAIDVLGEAGVPTLIALIRTGAYTLDAHTDPDYSVTLPNHFAMVTGRPAQGASGHNYTSNGFAGSTVHDTHGSYVASMFDVAHDHGVATGIASSKEKFQALSTSWDAAHGAPDTTQGDNGPSKLDIVNVAEQSDDVVVDTVVEALASDTAELLFLVHLRAPDTEGHATGFDVAPDALYLDAVRATDARVRTILDALVGDPDRCGSTAVLITTDHGGLGTSHSDTTRPQNTTIPFIAWGPRAAQGVDLATLNTERTSPIRNGDVGNLALDQLALPAIPGSALNAAFDLKTR